MIKYKNFAILILILLFCSACGSNKASSDLSNISAQQGIVSEQDKSSTAESKPLLNALNKLHPGVNIVKEEDYSDISVFACKDSKQTTVSLLALKKIADDYKEIWNTETSMENIDELYFEDINKDGLTELVAKGTAGAHSTYLYIYQHTGDNFKELLNQFGTDGIKLIDADNNDGIKEVQVGQRNYDATQTTTFRILKWNGKTYEEVKSNTDYTYGKDMTPNSNENNSDYVQKANIDLCLAGIYIDSSEKEVEKIFGQGFPIGTPTKYSYGSEKYIKYKKNVQVKYIQKSGDVYRVVSISIQPIEIIRNMVIYESWDATLTTGRGIHHGDSFQNIVNLYGNSYYKFKNYGLGYKIYDGAKPVWLVFSYTGQNGFSLNDKADQIDLYVETGYY